jgi:outer membrane protein assembly factor BamD (BamD/ComL family)
MDKDLYCQLQAAISQAETKEELFKIQEFVNKFPDSQFKTDLQDTIITELSYMGIEL